MHLKKHAFRIDTIIFFPFAHTVHWLIDWSHFISNHNTKYNKSDIFTQLIGLGKHSEDTNVSVGEVPPYTEKTKQNKRKRKEKKRLNSIVTLYT